MEIIILQGTTRACGSISILSDNILEGDELFALSLVGSGVDVFRSTATLLISDSGKSIDTTLIFLHVTTPLVVTFIFPSCAAPLDVGFSVGLGSILESSGVPPDNFCVVATFSATLAAPPLRVLVTSVGISATG